MTEEDVLAGRAAAAASYKARPLAWWQTERDLTAAYLLRDPGWKPGLLKLQAYDRIIGELEAQQ